MTFLIVAGGFLLFCGGMFLIIRLMLGGKKEPIPRLEELDTDQDFNVYYSANNSIFPGLAVMAYLVMLIGIVAIFSPYGRELGIPLTFAAFVFMVWVILRVRNADDREDRLLFRISLKGVTHPAKGFIPWEKIERVVLDKDTRQNEHLVMYVVNEDRKSGFQDVPVPVQFSRFGPRYIEAVMRLYRRKAGM